MCLDHFNSRSCEGATGHKGALRLGQRISTHAPVKERPALRHEHLREDMISTHAPVKERHEGVAESACVSIISTHAPVKERPRRDALSFSSKKRFQLTLL